MEGLTMFMANRLPLAIALLLIFVAANAAQAQCQRMAQMGGVGNFGAQNPAAQMMAARIAAVQYTQLQNSYTPRVPTADQLAQQGYFSYGQESPSCQPSRNEMRIAQMQQRRDSEK